MGGVGSGRKPGSKNKPKKKYENFKPAKEKEHPKGRVYSVPTHVKGIRTTSGCRFEG